jgi:hypothetical protein
MEAWQIWHAAANVAAIAPARDLFLVRGSTIRKSPREQVTWTWRM